MNNLKWYRSIFFKIAIGFIICLSIVPIMVFVYVHTSVRNDLIEQRAEESLRNLEFQRIEISLLLEDVIANINLLSESPSVIDYLQDPNDENREDVIELFSAFATAKRTYDQVRLLSPDGMEVIRINYNNDLAEVVPDSDLQDKSQRDYYQQTVNLSQNEVYISNLNLNQEEGVIEEPYNPALRYAMPLFDTQGNLQAILVLNLIPNEIFSVATQTTPHSTYYVANQNGDIMYTNSNVSNSVLYATDLNHETRIQNLIPAIPIHPAQPEYMIDSAQNNIITYSPIILNNGIQQRDWLLIREEPIENIIFPVNQTIRGIGVISVIGLFISLLLSFPIAYQIVNPLRALYLASKNLYIRDWQNSLRLTQTINSKDEIGELAKSFEDTLYELRNFYAQLDILVTERTAELKWANEQLKQVDLIKTSFMEDIAHDIRTPLSSIMLNTSMLKRKPSNFTQYIERIEKQTQRITALMENVNLMSNVELSFASDKALQPTLLHEILLPIIEAHRTTIELAEIELQLDIQPVPPMLGLKFGLQQLFENLLTNAIKYTLEGKISISLTHQNDVIKLIVEDTGIGIAEDELPHVKKRYYRAKGVRQSIVPGTGLGLSIVLEAISLHEGEFEISSTLGVGTKITVTLPIRASITPSDDLNEDD